MKNSAILLVISVPLWACNTASKVEETTLPKPQPIEIADAKYIGIGKQGLEDLSKGNIDHFINSMADNVVYKWNNGDSISGKANVAAFWKDRRANIIDTMIFKKDIWLTVKVNETVKNIPYGIYLMGWFDTSIAYTNGNNIKLSIHTACHSLPHSLNIHS